MTVSLKFGLQTPATSPPREVVGDRSPSASASVAAVVLGRGLVGPLRRDGRGDFAAASDVELIKSNVGQILGTIGASSFTTGEVPWRPEFGSLLHLLRFRNNDAVLRELAEQYVVDAVEAWEPRVRVKSVAIAQDVAAGRLEINMAYDVVSRRRTLLASSQQATFAVPVEAP